MWVLQRSSFDSLSVGFAPERSSPADGGGADDHRVRAEADHPWEGFREPGKLPQGRLDDQLQLLLHIGVHLPTGEAGKVSHVIEADFMF